MKRSPSPIGNTDFKLLFETLPGLVVVLLPDEPRFTVDAVSDSYLQAVKKSRSEMIGRGLFEIFHAGTHDASAHTLNTIRRSFEKVIATKEPDRLPPPATIRSSKLVKRRFSSGTPLGARQLART